MPEFSNGRAKQNWKPLWILAELAGGDWCQKLEASIAECEEEAQRELSFTDYLLRALRRFCEAYQKRPGVLARKPEQRDLIPTEEILCHTKGLNADKEAPWFATSNEGLTPERLGKELRGFPGVKRIQKRINVGQNPVRGYSYKALSVKDLRTLCKMKNTSIPPKKACYAVTVRPQSKHSCGVRGRNRVDKNL